MGKIVADRLKRILYDNLAVILFSVAAIMVLVISVYINIFIKDISVFLNSSIDQRLMVTVRQAASLAGADELAELTVPADKEKPIFKDIKQRLLAYSRENGIQYIYYFRIVSGGQYIQLIVDNNPAERTTELLSPVFPIEKPIQRVIDTRRAVILGLDDYVGDKDGLLTAYAPIFDDRGNIAVFAGIDIRDEQIIQMRNSIFILLFMLIVFIVFVIACGFLSFFIYKKKEEHYIKRYKQQELMSLLAQSFISEENIASLITNALRITGEFLNVSRMLIGVTEPNSDMSRAAYVWTATDKIVTAPKVAGLNDLINSFPQEQPKDGISPIYCNDTLLEERYHVFNIVGVKAIIMAPLYVDSRFWAVLSIEECFKARKWTDSDRQLVSLVSSVIAGAVARELRERERDTALEESERASKAKGDFLANMSHEMRTPMNAIIGMTAIAKSSSDIEKKQYCLNKIDDASTHLLGVINDILDMSKIEANKFELSPVEFNFEKMLQKMVNVINFRIEEKMQNFMVHIDKNIPPVLFGDDQRLSQVITNLLSNAVKFTPDEGAIHLYTHFEGEEDDICTIKISVSDTGIGINPERQAKLFSSFEQADSSTSRRFGGTGLGLAISKRIVEMMGGKIWLESEQGTGSTFSFTVKLNRGKEQPRSFLGPKVNRTNLRILAVDDAEDTLEFFKELAGLFEIYFDIAANGEDALACIIRNGPYDIYFIDWKMPGMDGIELTQQIKNKVSTGFDNKNVVIMISATEWSIIEDKAKEAGVDKFLPKPLFPSAIADCINECLGLEQGAVDLQHEQIDNFEGYSILLAEDVEINREIVLSLLEPTHLAIDCAENGQKAFELYCRAPDKYNAIFMDVQMPEMDGYEATRAIRRSGLPTAKTIPIIAMTANVFREDIEKCLDAGMNAHVGKPLDFEDVLARLREFLKK
ncbi:MAG: response regulator [Treponema sp.]|jgi:signal transduction histidine kinase/CheY-like chemotaxis protein|nr:response regulator [Treponema sp.]